MAIRIILVIFILSLISVIYMQSIADKRASAAEEYLRNAINIIEKGSPESLHKLLHSQFIREENLRTNHETISKLRENLYRLGAVQNYDFPVTSHKGFSLFRSDGYSDVFIVHSNYLNGKAIFNLSVTEHNGMRVVDGLTVSSNVFSDGPFSLKVRCNKDTGIVTKCEKEDENN